MPRSYRTHRPYSLLTSLLILLAMAYLWLHLVTPFDNGRLQPGANSIAVEGVNVAPLGAGPDGLQVGDAVMALGDLPIQVWVEASIAI